MQDSNWIALPNVLMSSSKINSLIAELIKQPSKSRSLTCKEKLIFIPKTKIAFPMKSFFLVKLECKKIV